MIARDYDREVQKAAEEHLRACYEELDAINEGMDCELIPQASYAPFCGCDTCVVREVVMAAWPILKEAFRAGEDPPPELCLCM